MTTAAAAGDVRKFYPVPQIEDQCYGIEQDFEVLSSSFAALALNTPHPSDATCFLQSETPTGDQGGFITRWTRRYYQIPPGWDDSENYAAKFPGTPGYAILPNSGSAGLLGRNSFTPPGGVDSRMHWDYFMVGAGRTYASADLIPLIPVQVYYPTAEPTQFGDSVVPAAGLTFSTESGGSQYFLPTTPTKETYFGWVTNAAAHGWASGYDDGTGKWQAAGQPLVTNPGQIVVECRKVRLMGNIWGRMTRYVLAQ